MHARLLCLIYIYMLISPLYPFSFSCSSLLLSIAPYIYPDLLPSRTKKNNLRTFLTAIRYFGLSINT